MADPLLSIRDLTVEFDTDDGIVHAVTDVSYDVFPGETLGIVGESGSGKSVSTMSLLGLIPSPPGRVVAGEASFNGRDLIKMKKKELRGLLFSPGQKVTVMVSGVAKPGEIADVPEEDRVMVKVAGFESFFPIGDVRVKRTAQSVDSWLRDEVTRCVAQPGAAVGTVAFDNSGGFGRLVIRHSVNDDPLGNSELTRCSTCGAPNVWQG